MKRRSEPTLEAVVQSVCRLPIDFDAKGDVSPADLVRRSGYRAARTEVTVERLAETLRAHADWVEEWFRWSADNRGSPAWYLVETQSGEFELGFYEGLSSQLPVTIADKVQATAEFVHRYVEHVADLFDGQR
jgi:hypothetical protein